MIHVHEQCVYIVHPAHVIKPTGVTVGFTTAVYSLAETAEAVEVCVAVLSGELGTDITLHLESRSGTALGKILLFNATNPD